MARPIPASEGDFDTVFSRRAAGIPGLEAERPMTRGAGMTAAGYLIRHESRCCTRRNYISIGSEAVGISDGRRHAILMLVSMGLPGEAVRQARTDFDMPVRSFRLDAAKAPVGPVPREGWACWKAPSPIFHGAGRWCGCRL